MKELVVLILAGGIGKRFSPFTTEKILFPFLGKPLVEFSVRQAIPKEASRIICITNEKNHELFRSLSFPIPHECMKQTSPTGMADAIVRASELIHGCSLLILIADDVFDPTLPQRVIQRAIETNAQAVLPGWKTDAYFPGGYLVIDSNQIKSIQEKPGEGNEPSAHVNISGHFIEDSDALLSAISSTTSEHDDMYEQALSQLMEKHTVVMEPYEGDFSSLKYPWHVLQVMDNLLSHVTDYRGEGVVIKPNVVIEGPVYLGNNVKIMEYTKIVGPCYIGDNTIVGNNNVIRYSMIGSNCVTGFSTDITRSYVGDDCWFHSNYIGDSVLEKNISMGSGAVLANLKLDEGTITSNVQDKKISTSRNKLGALIGQHVRIGVNASIMPGIKIGSNSFIGAGITLTQDIPEDSFVSMDTSIKIRKNTKPISSDREQFKKKI